MNKRAIAKETAVLALLVIILGASTAYLYTNPQKMEPTKPATVEYVIGMPIAVSGPYATEGPFRRDAAVLAVEEINGALEKSGSPIRFKAIYEDAKGTAEGALAAVQSLYAAGARVMIGPLSTGEVRGVKSFADSNKIVVISPSSTGVALALPGDYIFRAVASDLFQAQALAQVVSELGYTKISIIGRADDYGRGIADLFEKTFTDKYKGQVRKLLYTPGQTDYGAEVQRVASFTRELGADSKTAVLIIAFDDDGLNIFNNARLDPVLSQVRWFGSESLKRPSHLPPKSPPAVGDFQVTAKLTGLFPTQIAKSPVAITFEESYKKKFNKDPSAYSYYTYDSVWIAALAMLAAGKNDGETIAKILPEVSQKYVGASGYKKLDKNGDVESADYEIWQVMKDGDTYSHKRVGAWIGATQSVRLG